MLYDFIKLIFKQQMRVCCIVVQSIQCFRASRLTDYFSYRSRLSKLCQGRQTSRDVTVCIVNTGTQNKLLYQLCMRLARFLIIGQQPNIQLLSVFQYELSPVPHSLVDESGYLLKGDTSVLMKRLEVIAKVSQNQMCCSLITSYGERQEQWLTLRRVARHAS